MKAETPCHKNDVKLLSKFSMMTVFKSNDKVRACFAVNKDALEYLDAAVLDRFEKNASKIYQNRDERRYPDEIVRSLGVPLAG